MSRTKFYNSRKAISPVIATILLLAITVIIAVGVFQFLSQYTQDQLGQTQNNQILDNFNIRVIDSNAQESIIQTPFPELNVTRVLLDGTECEGNIGLVSGRPLRVNLSSCSQEITTNRPRLIIETEDGIIQRDLRSQDLGVSVGAGGGVTGGGVSGGSTFDCDDLPGEWITVPADNYFVEEDFCVMQFEAKQVGGVATSQAADTPWVLINFTDSRAACDQLNIEHSSFGGEFMMITNRQWMTIARNAEAQAVNWDSGIQGSGAMFRGNSNGGSALDGTSSLSGINTRTLTLSNGAVIWDLAGNVWQWVDLMEDGSPMTNVNACLGSSEFTTCSSSDLWNDDFSKNNSLALGLPLEREMGPSGDFDSTNGVGRILSSTSTVGRVLLRGGNWGDGGTAGAFATFLNYGPGFTSTYIGFRCAFEP